MRACKYGLHVSTLLTPAEIENRAKSAGLTMDAFCKRAGISFSTFSRWRAGQTVPSIVVYERMVGALTKPACDCEAA